MPKFVYSKSMNLNKLVNYVRLFYTPPENSYSVIIAPVKAAMDVVLNNTATHPEILSLVTGRMLAFTSDPAQVKPFAHYLVTELLPNYQYDNIGDFYGDYAVTWLLANGIYPHDVLTLPEAQKIWQKTNLRQKESKLFKWRSGGTWLTTLQAMTATYGPPPKS